MFDHLRFLYFTLYIHIMVILEDILYKYIFADNGMIVDPMNEMSGWIIDRGSSQWNIDQWNPKAGIFV